MVLGQVRKQPARDCRKSLNKGTTWSQVYLNVGTTVAGIASYPLDWTNPSVHTTVDAEGAVR